ncbi:FAD-dependent oxidoreductase [Exiguobacterium acetylicum]|uniref:FAD-dependent oxidoreductase n=1 Tax=Exiguobacterium acetylicum TaxID=41170 RepID=UPI001EE29A46|nr:FAD-dependent oxidoreductase [Exiguobacterium acetylicum]UKS57223.1 FAD-dependent oxidoreductase [Exiguobacterium acetylicum]
MTDHIIIGGGVIGLTLAYSLACQNESVLVLERGTCGQGTSRAAAGMLATDIELRDELHALAARSRHLYPLLARRLARETGIDCGYREQPFLLKRDEEEYLFPSVGQIDPRRLTKALTLALHKRGIPIEEQVDVTRIEESDDVVKVESKTGMWTGRTVTVAAGRGSQALLATAGISIATYGVKGECLAVRLAGRPLRSILFDDSVYLVPKADGRILIGATELPHDETVGVSVAGVTSLLQAAERLYPPIRDAVIEEVWSGVRPQTISGLPYIGVAASARRIFLATGHHRHGILLAPATAEVLSAALRLIQKEEVR